MNVQRLQCKPNKNIRRGRQGLPITVTGGVLNGEWGCWRWWACMSHIIILLFHFIKNCWQLLVKHEQFVQQSEGDNN